MSPFESCSGMVPPYSKEAEVACLGAIFLNVDAINIVSEVLSVDDFYLESSRYIYGAMVELHGRGDPVDHVTVGSLLIDSGKMQLIGGPMALDELTKNVCTIANVESYAKIVRENSQRRSILYAAQKVVSSGFGSDTGDELLEHVKGLNSVCASYGSKRMPNVLFDYGDSVLENYERLKSGVAGIPFPWDSITDISMGQWPGTMTIFVARPGIGKTMVCVLSARNAWSLGKRVLVVSPEMAKEEIAERFFVFDSEISYGNVIRGKMSSFEMEKLKGAIDCRRGQDNFWIMDAKDDLSGKGIDEAIRACNPDYVSIDSIYMLRFKGDKSERMQSAIDWFGQSTKKFGYAGCAFSQLNRTAGKSEKFGGGIKLETIALSDQIGWDAHAIFGLEQDADMKADRKMRFIPIKVRRGSYTSSIMVNWDFDRMNFSEVGSEDAYKDNMTEDPFDY